MIYQPLDITSDMQAWAWKELREANDWLYYCYFDPVNEHRTDDRIEEVLDDARWKRRHAMKRAKFYEVDCEMHIFVKNERGHNICRKCHYFSILEASL